MHSLSVQRDKQIRIEQGLKQLSQAFIDQRIVRQSKTIIDAFDLIKYTAQRIKEQISQLKDIQVKILKKSMFKRFRQFLRHQRRAKRNKIILEQAKIRRKTRLMSKMLRKLKQVLKLESLWLAEVRYQFTYGIREDVFEAFKMYKKYSKVKYNRKLTKYIGFMHQLRLKVEQSRLRQADALVYHQKRLKKKIIAAIANHMRQRLIKKAKKSKAKRFAELKLK